MQYKLKIKTSKKQDKSSSHLYNDTPRQRRSKKVVFDDEIDEIIPKRRTKKNIMDEESQNDIQIIEPPIQKKCQKLVKKQEIVLQAAQQDLTSCAICYGDMAELQTVILPCSHMFCKKCIKLLINKSENNCPLCRKRFKYFDDCVRIKDGEFLRGQSNRVRSKKRQQKYDSEEIEIEQQQGSQDIQYQNQHPIHTISFNIQDESCSIPYHVDDAEDSFIMQEDCFCEECKGNEDFEAFVFCIRCQNVVCHTYCRMLITSNDITCITCKTLRNLR